MYSIYLERENILFESEIIKFELYIHILRFNIKKTPLLLSGDMTLNLNSLYLVILCRFNPLTFI